MPLPLNVDLVTVRGTYVYSDGSIPKGRVQFTPRAPRMVDIAAVVTILGKTVAVDLDANGSFEIDLPACDDPDLTPNGFTYLVREDFSGGSTYSISVPLSAKTDGIDVTQTVPVPSNAGIQVLVPDQWSAEYEQAAADAAAARTDADAAAASAASMVDPQTYADFFGYVPVYSATPPADTTLYGKPVVWIDSSATLTPVPVNPPSPTWDDSASTIIVPSGVVGVDYVATSGGGLVPGTVLAQGATVATSGTYPRTVTITPVAQESYVLATSGMTFVHDFPDPNAIIVVASDSFSGTPGTGLNGRAMDLALGGTPHSYALQSGTTDYAAIDSTGSQLTNTQTSSYRTYLVTTTAEAKNWKVEFDVTPNAALAANADWVQVNLTAPTLSGASPNLMLLVGSTGARIYMGSTIKFPNIGAQVGVKCHVTLTWYEDTVTYTVTGGNAAGSVSYSSAGLLAHGDGTTYPKPQVQLVFGGTRLDHWNLDNLKISKVGY